MARPQLVDRPWFVVVTSSLFLVAGVAALVLGLIVSQNLYGVGCNGVGCVRIIEKPNVAVMLGFFLVAAVCLSTGGRNLSRRARRRAPEA